VQKLAEANAALEAFAPLISKDAFEQAQTMLSRGDVLGQNASSSRSPIRFARLKRRPM
jgi:hypothetical protein